MTALLAVGETIVARKRSYVIEQLVSLRENSIVYRARPTPVDIPPSGRTSVAIKIYDTSPDNEGRAQVTIERAQQARIENKHIAKLVDDGELADGARFLVSEWIDGETLTAALTHGPLPWELLLPILSALASGLAALHNVDIVHGDVTPDNIVLPARGFPSAMIINIGHSLYVASEGFIDRGMVSNSASHMTPEYAAGFEVDARADLYGLGTILYQALTGEAPFADGSQGQLLRCHQQVSVRPPRKSAPHLKIPATADDLCMWLLEKDRERRVPNARVLGVTLRSLIRRDSSPKIVEGQP